MLPAVWGAWKAAGIAGKALSIGLPIVLVVGSYWTGKWIGYGDGYEECQEEHAQAALKQATQVVEHTAKQAQLPAEILQGFIREREEGEQIRATLQAKIRAYERERKQRPTVQQEPTHETPEPVTCPDPDPMDDSFVDTWDAIGRMFLEEADIESDVSATDRDSAGLSGLPDTDIQTATLLRAREAEFAEYKRLKDHYGGLREFSKGVYILQKIWQESQRQESDGER